MRPAGCNAIHESQAGTLIVIDPVKIILVIGGRGEMASERFWRLPPEKQKAIYEAAIEEFIRIPFEKVSINKIIQKAGISRGSFYTYFEDKRELLSFVLEDTKTQWLNFCENYLKKSGGDFWGMMEAMLDKAIEFCRVNDVFRFRQNLMMYQEFTVMEMPSKKETAKMVRSRLHPLVDHSIFREETEEYFAMVMEQSLFTVFSSIACYYKNPQAEKEIKEDYQKKINILRYGACKTLIENQMEE